MAQTRALARDLTVPPPKDAERRARFEHDDCGWLRTYVPEVFNFPFTPDQKHIVAEVGEALRYGTAKAIAAPRGDGKSSITKYLTLKYGLYRQIRFGLIICATGKKSQGALQGIKNRLRSRPGTPLFDDFPLECMVARYVGPAPSKANNVTVVGKRVHVEWTQDRVILPTFADEEGSVGPILMAIGVTSDALQGCNVYDIRPDFVILDDLDSRESLAAAEGTVAAKIEQIIDQNVGGLGGPGQRLGQVMLCTITSRDSVAFTYSDPLQKPAWSGVRFKRLKAWPARRDLWNEYIERRQKGQNTRKDPSNPTSEPIDPYGRDAHRFYLANRAEMDRGAVLSNPHDFNRDKLPDGSHTHISALQKCFDYIADKGEKSFLTEHQNDPPEEEGVERIVLTAYHIQHNCRTRLEQAIVPADAVCVACGVDIKKLGFHYVSIAFDAHARGCIVEYNFHELLTERMEIKDVELAILAGLHEWADARDAEPYIDTDGHERLIDLALIDEGWKHETWATQPVRRFCAERGLTRFLPCKGESPYTTPRQAKNIVGDNWHVTFGQVPLVMMSSDHWKQKVHAGFLTPPGEPGNLALFETNRKPPHLSYSKHILAEVWERRFQPGFRGWREGFWKVGSQNHYLDGTYQALVGGSLWGISALAAMAKASPPAAPREERSPPPSSGGGRTRSW